MRCRTRWIVLLAASVISSCVLGFYQTTNAAPKGNPPPFANSVEQRLEMVEVLKEIRDLLKEQNALLRAGSPKGIVGQPASQPGK